MSSTAADSAGPTVRCRSACARRYAVRAAIPPWLLRSAVGRSSPSASPWRKAGGFSRSRCRSTCCRTSSILRAAGQARRSRRGPESVRRRGACSAERVGAAAIRFLTRRRRCRNLAGRCRRRQRRSRPTSRRQRHAARRSTPFLTASTPPIRGRRLGRAQGQLPDHPRDDGLAFPIGVFGALSRGIRAAEPLDRHDRGFDQQSCRRAVDHLRPARPRRVPQLHAPAPLGAAGRRPDAGADDHAGDRHRRPQRDHSRCRPRSATRRSASARRRCRSCSTMCCRWRCRAS